MRIIGLCGFKGSGKDTVGNILKHEEDFVTLSFADSVKDVVCAVFGYDREMIEGNTKESRQWREEVDTWWSRELNIPNLTPRETLTLVGTDLFRNLIHDEIWIKNVHRKVIDIQNSGKNICITDIRFKNEFDFVKNILCGNVYYIEKEKPSWFNIAMLASMGNKSQIEEIKKLKIHQSEWDFLSKIKHCDDVIENKGTLGDLTNTVEKIILKY